MTKPNTLDTVLSYLEKQLDHDIGVLGANHEVGFVDGAETLGEVWKAFTRLKDTKTVRIPVCPHCGELTHLGGEFLPCCGEENDTDPDNVQWVRLLYVR